MAYSSINLTIGIAAMVALIAAMLVLIEAGRRLGHKHNEIDPENTAKGLGALEGAVFGLMGLLIAFTFSGAGSRFEHRRDLIVQEANAIGTAYLRLSLLPAGAQPKLRENLRQYVDSRLAFYRNLAVDPASAKQADNRANMLQREIWNDAIEATRQLGSQPNTNAVTSLVMQSLNEMFDIATTRMVALENHPPAIVYWMLIALVLICSLLVGYGTAARKSRSWIHIAGYTVILTASILIILDYEYPRYGWIRIDSADQLLINVRQGMSE